MYWYGSQVSEASEEGAEVQVLSEVRKQGRRMIRGVGGRGYGGGGGRGGNFEAPVGSHICVWIKAPMAAIGQPSFAHHGANRLQTGILAANKHR